MNWGVFALVFGGVSGIFALALLAGLAVVWIEDRFGTFAAICFGALLVAVVAGLVAAVLA